MTDNLTFRNGQRIVLSIRRPVSGEHILEAVMKRETHKVEFNAHKTVKRPTAVGFTTKQGEKVRFTAEKPTKVPVHVKFRAKDKN
ncbi:MAG TPA: hypothetical protein VGK36_13050 [Candidatus Angelobacter sp.]|jgi:hypothetical protein